MLSSTRLRLLCLALTITSAGCSRIGTIDHYQLSAAQLEAYRDLQVVTDEERGRRNFRSLGEIRGISCKGRHIGCGDGTNPCKQVPSEADAMDQLHLQAALAGGHAIAEVSCTASDELDWKNNCWSTVICSAELLVDEDFKPGSEN